MHYVPEMQNISQLVETKLGTVWIFFKKGILYCIISNNKQTKMPNKYLFV